MPRSPVSPIPTRQWGKNPPPWAPWDEGVPPGQGALAKLIKLCTGQPEVIAQAAAWSLGQARGW